MKKLGNIVRWCVGILLTLYLVVLCGVNFSPSRKWLARETADLLSEKIGSKVAIGDLRIGMFNRVVLTDVYIEDKARQPLLKAGQLSAKIELKPLLEGKVSLRSIILLDGDCRLYRETANSAPNFQFIIDAFQSEEPKEPSRLDLRINSLVVRRTQLSYDECYRPQTHGKLNPHHLRLSGIDANVSLKCLTPDSIHLRLRSLSLREQCGLHLQRLSFLLTANRHEAKLERFQLHLPATRLATSGPLRATYDFPPTAKAPRAICLQGSLSDNRISTDDLSPLIPALRPLGLDLCFSADFNVRPDGGKLTAFRLKEANGGFQADLSADVKLRNGELAATTAEIRKITTEKKFFSGLVKKITSEEVSRLFETLGNITLTGQAHYDKEGDSKAQLSLDTEQGSLRADLQQRNADWQLHCHTTDVNPAVLAGNDALPRTLTCDLKATATLREDTPLRATAQLDIGTLALAQAKLSSLRLTADFDGHTLTAEATANDPSLSTDLSAILRLEPTGEKLTLLGQKLPKYRLDSGNLRGSVAQLAPHIFGIAAKDLADVSCEELTADITSFNAARPEGSMSIRGLTLTKEESFRLENLQLRVLPLAEGARVALRSDIVDADAEGRLSIPALSNAGRQVVAHYLPWLLPHSASDTPTTDKWAFSAYLHHLDEAAAFFNLPLQQKGAVDIRGRMDAGERTALLTIYCDGLDYKGTALDDIKLYAKADGTELTLLTQASRNISGQNVCIVADAVAQDGQLRLDLNWNDEGQNHYYGRVSTLTTESSEEGTLLTTQIVPSAVTIADTTWQIASGRLSLQKEGVEIHNLSVRHADQALTVDGKLSGNERDRLEANLERLDVAYILDLVDFHTVEFAGRASGKVVFSKAETSPLLDAHLQVGGFRFNDAYLGEADIRGNWDSAEGQINLNALMTEQGVGSTQVLGYVSPKRKGLDLHITADKTNLEFLRTYVGSILHDVEGRTTGQIRVFGPFKEIDFEGEMLANAAATVPATGVRYHVGDCKVDIRPGTFSFSNGRISDKGGGSGTIGGYLSHTHLKELRYGFDVDANGLLLYDQPRTADLSFYATAAGTGKVHLDGHPGALNAQINIKPARGSMLTYIVDTPESFNDVQLLTITEGSPFRMTSLPDSSIPDGTTTDDAGEAERGYTIETLESRATESGTDIKLDFIVEMNPEATLRVIMDDRAGDYIDLHGAGNLYASFYNKGNFRMYGLYSVESGVYKMSIQDLIRKNFEIQRGSSILFNGEPYQAALDLKAVYVVNSASLSDLNIGNAFSQNSVRVNCILNIGGVAAAPQVSFDLDLPTVNNDEARMVRNLISSEENMNMQIIYLLGVGRFYTQNYAATEAATQQSQSATAVNSFLSNTLSSQLNDIISNAIGNSNWSFGTNLSTGNVGWSDMEFEGILSGRLLNNRLLFNGNFGYRDRQTSYQTTNFVGDFDVRYLLTPNGSVSLKAYSETNDRYFTKSALSTQGVGIQLSRDFRNLRDLFTRRRSTSPKRTTDNVKNR